MLEVVVEKLQFGSRMKLSGIENTQKMVLIGIMFNMWSLFSNLILLNSSTKSGEGRKGK